MFTFNTIVLSDLCAEVGPLILSLDFRTFINFCLYFNSNLLQTINEIRRLILFSLTMFS